MSSANTNFTRTSLINLLVGNVPGEPGSPDWSGLERQLKLIQDELNEAKESVAKRDLETLRDDVGDILFTTYGLGYRADLPVDADYLEVVRSNMTKFDRSEEAALATKAKYAALGVETVFERRSVEMSHEVGGNSPDFHQTEAFYITYSAFDQIGNDGKSYPGRKYLKSTAFEEPNYAPLESSEA